MESRIQKQVEHCASLGTLDGVNIIAFSGGVDSSLAAMLVKRAFPSNTVACIGVSPSLSHQQLLQARQIAQDIDIELREVATDEAQFEGYVENNGQACFFCKTSLYSMLEQVASKALSQIKSGPVVLFNGTNQDDTQDPSRVGLIAAKNFKVASPLSNLTKDEVRGMAKHLGLLNWNYAASPCLRSRLQYGVQATPDRLKRVEVAEEIVRKYVPIKDFHNLRVRTMVGEHAVIELDGELENAYRKVEAAIRTALIALGFSGLEFRPFRSGSLSRTFQAKPNKSNTKVKVQTPS